MKWSWISVSAVVLGAGLALGQANPPASADATGALGLRATQAFDKSDFAVALPMLQKLADQLKQQPAAADKLAMVQEQIRVCQKNQAPQLASAAGVTAVGDTSLPSPAAGAPTVAMGTDRKPHPIPQPGQVQEMEIKELGNFEFDAEHGSPIPTDVQRLSGSTIRLHGYMIPMDQAENISKFALVPSLFACCYGQPPQIQHTIVVNCPKGKAISYYPDEIIVQGKLSVDEKKDDGFIVSIFELDTTSVKPAAK